MGRAAVVVCAVLVAAFAVLVAVPELTAKREYPASVPQPQPLFFTSLVKVPPGESACFGDAVMEAHSEEARVQVGTLGRRGIPLELRIQGPGYSHRARVSRYRDNDVLRIPVRRPPRSIPVRVCIENKGRHRFDLYGAEDRTKSRSEAEVGGDSVSPGIVFSFWERTPRSLLDRFPQTIERMTTFRPPFVGEWLLWPLAVLFALGVPVAVLWGFARSLRG